MCLSSIWFYLFACCVVYDNRVLDGSDDYAICTTNCFIQNSLDFRKWLVYNDFVLNGTTRLV